MCRQKHMTRTQAIRGALRGTQRHLEAIKGTQRRTEEHSEAIKGNQRHSEALKGTQRRSEEHSEAITRLIGPVALNKATHEHRPSLVDQAPAQRRGFWREGLWKPG